MPNPMDVPPKAILEIALGVQKPSEVLSRYGYTTLEAEQLLLSEVFQRRVREEREELEEKGDIDKLYNRMCYRLIRERLLAAATSGELPPSDLVKAAEMMHRHAGMSGDEKGGQSGATGPVINITFGGGMGAPAIELRRKDAMEAAVVIPEHVRRDSPALTRDKDLFELLPDAPAQNKDTPAAS